MGGVEAHGSTREDDGGTSRGERSEQGVRRRQADKEAACRRLGGAKEAEWRISRGGTSTSGDRLYQLAYAALHARTTYTEREGPPQARLARAVQRRVQPPRRELCPCPAGPPPAGRPPSAHGRRCATAPMRRPSHIGCPPAAGSGVGRSQPHTRGGASRGRRYAPLDAAWERGWRRSAGPSRASAAAVVVVQGWCGCGRSLAWPGDEARRGHFWGTHPPPPMGAQPERAPHRRRSGGGATSPFGLPAGAHASFSAAGGGRRPAGRPTLLRGAPRERLCSGGQVRRRGLVSCAGRSPGPRGAKNEETVAGPIPLVRGPILPERQDTCRSDAARSHTFTTKGPSLAETFQKTGR